MATAGLYMRALPCPPAIEFASSDGQKLFMEAMRTGKMRGFFNLIPHFKTQPELTYCGLTSISMVLNALAIDPGRKWKGPWRWFDESMLDSCELKVKAKGISFGNLVCVAHCAGASVKAFRTNQSTLDDFRKYVKACSSSDHCHVISSYHRGTLKQTGAGHFSPIGGYHAERDMVLILDVARFLSTVLTGSHLAFFGKRWILLWELLDYVEGKSVRARVQASEIYTPSCKHEGWIATAKYLLDDVPQLLSSQGSDDISNILSVLFASLPPDFSEYIKWVAEVRRIEDRVEGLSEEGKGRLAIKEEVLKQVQETALYKHVNEALSLQEFGFQTRQKSSGQDNLPEIAASNDVLTALLLALPSETWLGIKDKSVVEDLVCIERLPDLLREEVCHLRGQATDA